MYLLFVWFVLPLFVILSHRFAWFDYKDHEDVGNLNDFIVIQEEVVLGSIMTQLFCLVIFFPTSSHQIPTCRGGGCYRLVYVSVATTGWSTCWSRRPVMLSDQVALGGRARRADALEWGVSFRLRVLMYTFICNLIYQIFEWFYASVCALINKWYVQRMIKSSLSFYFTHHSLIGALYQHLLLYQYL